MHTPPQPSAGHPAAATPPVNTAASIFAAIATISIVGMGLSLSIPLLAIELESRGIARTWIGLNTAMGGISTVLIAMFVPTLVKRFGARAMLVGAIVLAAVTLLTFRVTGPFALWFPLRFIYGATLCVLFVVSEFWINATAPPARRGLIMGIYATALSLGFAVGPAVLSVVGFTGWPPYLAGAVLFAIGIVPVMIGGGLAPEIHAESRSGVIGFMRIAPAATMAALIFGAVETAMMSFLPLYGIRLGLPQIDASFLLTIAVLGNVAFQIPLGLLSDRLDRRRVLLSCALAGLAGILVLPHLAADGWSMRIAVFLTMGLVGGLYTVGLAHLGARFHGADLATANSAFVMLYSIGLIVGPPLVGAGMDAIDPQGFAFTLAALLAIYVGVVARRMMTAR